MTREFSHTKSPLWDPDSPNNPRNHRDNERRGSIRQLEKPTEKDTALFANCISAWQQYGDKKGPGDDFRLYLLEDGTIVNMAGEKWDKISIENFSEIKRRLAANEKVVFTDLIRDTIE